MRVTDLGDWKKSILIALHELVELAQTESDGIPEPVIKAFDEAFEAAVAKGEKEDGEPGNQPDAPYRKQHGIAEGVERILASEMNVGWDDYNNACEHAFDEP